MNPMMFLLLLGIGICFSNLFSIIMPLLFIFVVAMVFVAKAKKLLKEVFGQEYEE